jgi:hypothetical protein
MNKFLEKIWPKIWQKNLTASREVANLSETREIEALGARDIKILNSNQKIKTAPTEAISFELTNSDGAARSTIPDCHLIYSVSYWLLMSNEAVDNQKPRLGRAFDSVEDRGFAPLDSQVAIRGRHYVSPTVIRLYHE